MGDAAGGEGPKPEDRKIVHTYPLIKNSDMPEETRMEAMELCVSACEKYAYCYELAARQIKDNLDKKFGASFHVVVGEGFGFEISYECKNLMFMYTGGNIAALAWKC